MQSDSHVVRRLRIIVGETGTSTSYSKPGFLNVAGMADTSVSVAPYRRTSRSR